MSELRTWVLAQLLWNPLQDERALIREFLEGYYSEAAAKPIWAYLELMHRESEGFYLACFLRPNAPHLKFKPLAAAEALWSEAERLVANDADLLARVQQGHLPVRHAFLANWEQLRRECQEQHASWPLPDSRKTVADQFREVTAGLPGREWTRVHPLNESNLKVEEFLKPFAE